MKNTRKKIYSLALVLVSGLLQAQETFPDDTQDVPINDWILPVIILGIVLIWHYIQRQKLKLNSKKHL